MGFALIIDTESEHGFRLRGGAQPTDELYNQTREQLDSLVSVGLDELDGQHIGFVTEDGIVDVYTQYKHPELRHSRTPQ